MKKLVILLIPVGMICSNYIHSPRMARTNEGHYTVMMDRSFGIPSSWSWSK